MEYDVTKVMRNWSKGAPNYGLLVKVVNEEVNSQDIRFYSKYHSNSRRHLFIYVTCNNKTIEEVPHLEIEGGCLQKKLKRSNNGLGNGKKGFTCSFSCFYKLNLVRA